MAWVLAVLHSIVSLKFSLELGIISGGLLPYPAMIVWGRGGERHHLPILMRNWNDKVMLISGGQLLNLLLANYSDRGGPVSKHYARQPLP